MPVIAANPKPVPSMVPVDLAGDPDIPGMSDDACLARLAKIVRERDLAHLDEMARLIARLAVAIE